MSSDDLMIRVRGLAKRYTIRHNANDHITVAELAVDRLKHPLQRTAREDFWALRDVEFDVQRGEVLGLVGRNGAGKSTLLKVLTRITDPSAGRIDLWGRVGSLLEVGTGFHPELTGRENVYLNGSILGMTSKEIAKQFDAIVDFAGVERFLDTPVKRYSSGMYVRLAFAVAAHLETDILLLDEVLAVGDADFQAKCLSKVSTLARTGRTVVLVSHSASVVSSAATSALLLHEGRVVARGAVDHVLAELGGMSTVARDLTTARRAEAALGGRARLLGIRLPEAVNAFRQGGPISYLVELSVLERMDAFTISQSIRTSDGQKLGSAFSNPVPARVGRFEVSVALEGMNLVPGRYLLGVAIGSGDASGDASFYDVVQDALEITIEPAIGASGLASRWDASWGAVNFPQAEARVRALQRHTDILTYGAL